MRGLVFAFVDINKEKECCDMKTSVSPGTQVLNTEKLMDAFQCFNELSKDLSDSYQQLQKQVAPALITSATPAPLWAVASDQNADDAGLVAIMYKPVINPALSAMRSEIKQQTLMQRPIIEPGVWGHTVDTETDPLAQQNHVFGKSVQGHPVMGLKKNEMADWINEIEVAARSEETIPRFAAEMAPLNSAVLLENKEILLPMGKHFAHPEWQKEMGKWMLWLHKQAIPMAELRLNPRHLGPITIRIEMQQEQSTVSFIARHAVVKEAIEAAIPKLREMFSVQQLNLTEVNVSQQDAGQRQKGFSQMHNGQGHDKNKEPDFMAEHDQQRNLLDLTEEIEAGRAIASYGVLSLFA